MFDSQIVRAHVIEAVKRALIPPLGPETFSFDLVPSAKPPKGLGADEQAWAKTLKRIAKTMRAMKVVPGYGKLRLKQGDARRTLNEPLHKTVDLLVERILATAVDRATSGSAAGEV